MFSLGFFSLEGNPSLVSGYYIVVVYCMCIFSERETDRETVRENRGYYGRSTVGCVSSFCWIIERKDWLFGVDVAQTG